MNDQEKLNPESNPDNTAQAAMDKLIQLNEKSKMQTAPDLNSRLGDIESELKHLNARESATNKSFRELLSETKKHSANQTAELDKAREKIAVMSDQYKKMTQDYQRLAASGSDKLPAYPHAVSTHRHGDAHTPAHRHAHT